MKRLISILVIVTMLFASVMAMIPASATVAAEALATYNVNWKALVEGNKMKTRYVYDPDKYVYTDIYNVTATENSITSTAKNTGPEYNVSYYSEDMFKITADTYYEYDFAAKNFDGNPAGYAGVIFAYGADEDAYCADGDKGTQEKIEGAYILWGAFQNESDKDGGGTEAKLCLDLYYGRRDADFKYCLNSGSVAKGVGKEDSEGYITYKIIYDGYSVSFFYKDEAGDFVEVLGKVALELPEDSSVCVGMYNRGGKRYVHIKDAKITAGNRAAAFMINGVSEDALPLALALDAADEIVATDYTDDTAKAFTDAVEAGLKLLDDTTADATAFQDAADAIYTAIDNLEYKKADLTALGEKIAELDTIDNLYDKYNQKTIDDWVARAEAAMENEDILISEVNALIAEFDAMIADEAIAVTSADDFANMDPNGNYILTQNITITEAYGNFKGFFNGNGKTITLNGANGVFNTLNGAVVKNLIIDGSIEHTDSVGALATNANGEVFITNVVNGVDIVVNASNKNVAGLIAQANGAIIYFSDCVNNGAIVGGRTAGFLANVTGSDNCFYFYNCVNTGNISCGESVNQNPAAGFLARAVDGNTLEIQFMYCANTGLISGTYSSAALFGCGSGDVSIYGCFNSGDVFVDYDNPQDHVRPIGGFVGGSSNGSYTVYVEKSIQNANVTVEDNYEGNPVALLVGGSKGNVVVSNVVVAGTVTTKDNNVYKITSNDNLDAENVYVTVEFCKRTFVEDTTQTPSSGDGSDDNPFIYPVITVDTPNPDAVDTLADTNLEGASKKAEDAVFAAANTLFEVIEGLDINAKAEAIDAYFEALAELVASVELNAAKEYAKLYVESLKKAPDAYTAESYAAYLADINALIARIDAVDSYEDMDFDGDKMIADAEAKLVTLEAAATAALAAAKETALTALSAKKENAGNVYTADSYTAYLTAYDAIVAQINGAATIEALNAIDVAALKVAAEAKLVVAPTTAPEDDETDDKVDETTAKDDDKKDDETEAKADDETEAKKEGGCGSSVALSALAVIGVIGTAVVLKKKED